LRFGKFVEVIENRCTQLLKPGEGQFHVGLHARHLDAAESRGLLLYVPQQSGLAYAGLTA
jgi:hypothetical protein